MLKKELLTIILLLSMVGLAHSHPLDYYLKKALENSPLLKEYSNQILSGKLDSMLANAAYKPQVNQISRAMYAPVAKNFGYDEAITDGGNYAALVEVVQPLFNKRRKDGQFKDIALTNQTIAADAMISENDLKQGVTSQYLTTYADYLQVEYNKSTSTLLQQEIDILKPLVAQGIYPQTDLMNLMLSVNAQDIAVRQAFIQYRNNLAVLNFICGIADTTSVNLEKPDITIRNSFEINSSPMMIKFRIDSLKNANSKQMIDLNYRPKMNAFADAGFNAIRPQNIPHNFGTSFGVNFTLPIYDGEQRKIQYDKTALAESTRMGYQKFYAERYRQQILQLTEQLKMTDELISGIKKQVTEQEKLIDIYKIEIEKGLVRFLDFLGAVNNYASVKNNLTLAEMNRLQIINQMNYLK